VSGISVGGDGSGGIEGAGGTEGVVGVGGRAGVGSGIGADAGGSEEGAAQALNRRIVITRIGINIRFILASRVYNIRILYHILGI